MLRKPKSWCACVASVVFCGGLLAAGGSAFAQQIKLNYEPKKGDAAVYDVIVHSEVKDAAGFSLVTDMTSTLQVNILDVKRDLNVKVGQNNIVSVTTEITQKNGSVKVVSGKNEKTMAVEDKTLQVVSDRKGAVKDAPAGLDQAVLDLIANVYRQVGSASKLSGGQEWKLKVLLPCGQDKIPAEVTWRLIGHRMVEGQDCIIVSSAGKIVHQFKGPAGQTPIRKATMEWTGEAAYAYQVGEFASITLTGRSSGELEDKTAVEGAFSYSLGVPKKKADAPAETGAAAGLVLPSMPSPMGPAMLACLLAAGLALAVAKMRRRTLSKVLASAVVLALITYGMPVNTAEAATPGALLAFANFTNQVVANGAGLAGAGAAGVCMGEPARASALGVTYSSAPAWSASNLQGAAAGLTPEFIEAAPAVAGQPGAAAVGGAEKASAGLFTATNMLIGGGVLLAAGGGIVAANAGGGSGGSRDCGAPVLLTDVTTDQNITITINGALFDGTDAVTVTYNGSVVASRPIGTGIVFSATVEPGKNCLDIRADSEGTDPDDGVVELLVVFERVTLGDQLQILDSWNLGGIPTGTSAKCTINR